jgi:oligoribonuclease
VNQDPIEDRLLWLDLETTGLIPEKTVILEIGAAIVSNKFEIIDKFNRVIMYHVDPPMDDWCRTTHSNSGLLQAIARDGVPLRIAELAICAWLDEHFPDNLIVTLNNTEKSREGRIILCGTGIHFDRRYIRYHMPLLNEKLHHRMIDVSAAYYFKKIFGGKEMPEKKKSEQLEHRALSDVYDSINLSRSLNGQS